MALSHFGIFEIAAGATANNVNAGYFNPENPFLLNDLTVNSASGQSATVFVSSPSYQFIPADIGNYLYVQSNTASFRQGWYLISSTSFGVAQLNASAGSVVFKTDDYGPPCPAFLVSGSSGIATTSSPSGASWTVDYSQSLTEWNLTVNNNLVSLDGTAGSSSVTSVGNNFGPNLRGNGLRVTAGTNFTQGWYEIWNTTGSTILLDRAVGTAATLGSGTFRIGGAMSLGSTTDDDLFENARSVANVGATRFFVKGSYSYSIGEGISVSAAGNASAHAFVFVEGYATRRGDQPEGDTRPTLAFGTNSFAPAGNWGLYNLKITGNTSSLVTTSAAGALRVFFCKIYNNTNVAARIAINVGAAGDSFFYGNEVVCFGGTGIVDANAGHMAIGNYLHDSFFGFRLLFAANTVSVHDFNLFVDNQKAAIAFGAITGGNQFRNNTFYGNPNRSCELGIVGSSNLVGGNPTDLYFYNNLFYGLETGARNYINSSTNLVMDFDYNHYYNCGTNSMGFAKGPHSTNNIDPVFSGVGFIEGTTGSTNGTTFTDASANFTTVTNEESVLTIGSNSSATPGKYLILDSSTTTLTLSFAPGASNNIKYHIITGHNFNIGTPLKAMGSPLKYGKYTTNSLDPGAIQRAETTSSGSATPTTTAYTFIS